MFLYTYLNCRTVRKHAATQIKTDNNYTGNSQSTDELLKEKFKFKSNLAEYDTIMM